MKSSSISILCSFAIAFTCRCTHSGWQEYRPDAEEKAIEKVLADHGFDTEYDADLYAWEKDFPPPRRVGIIDAATLEVQEVAMPSDEGWISCAGPDETGERFHVLQFGQYRMRLYTFALDGECVDEQRFQRFGVSNHLQTTTGLCHSLSPDGGTQLIGLGGLHFLDLGSREREFISNVPGKRIECSNIQWLNNDNAIVQCTSYDAAESASEVFLKVSRNDKAATVLYQSAFPWPEWPAMAAVSLDGKKAAFCEKPEANAPAPHLRVLDLESGRIESVFANAKNVPLSLPAWAPSGKKVAFLMDDDLCVLNLEDSSLRSLHTFRRSWEVFVLIFADEDTLVLEVLRGNSVHGSIYGIKIQEPELKRIVPKTPATGVDLSVPGKGKVLCELL